MVTHNRQSRIGTKDRRTNVQPTKAVRSARATAYKRYHPGKHGAGLPVKEDAAAHYASEAYASGAPKGPGAEDAAARQKALSGQYSRDSAQYSTKNKKGSRKKKVIIGIACALAVIFAGCGVAYALFANDINARLSGDKTDEEMQKIADVLVPVKNYTDPFYVLLIGSDAREGDDEMGQRSDTNILVRIDPSKGIITMVSIPRDTMIDIEGYGTNKFNAAYQYEGAPGTIKEASKLCGVDISHVFEIDFERFIQMIDALGGVEVDVPERIYDPDAGPYIIEAGWQTLNGERALEFARSRNYSDGDFTRVSNQRLLIEAIIEKVYQKPLTDMPGVIQLVASCITTDMKFEDIVGIATQMKKLDEPLTVYSATVPSYTAMINEVSYVITDKDALKEMMALVDAGKDPSTVVPSGNYDSGSSPAYTPSPAPSYDGDTYYQPPATTPAPDTGVPDTTEPQPPEPPPTPEEPPSQPPDEPPPPASDDKTPPTSPPSG